MSDTQIVQMLIKGRNDLEWFDTNLNKLLDEYNEKFVAVTEESVIDSDSDLGKLMKKLEQKNIDTSNVLIKFVSKVKFIL